MINGLPGPMALESAKACLDRGFTLAPVGFTGPSRSTSLLVEGKHRSVSIELFPGPGISAGRPAADIMKELKQTFPKLIVIDYTNPSAALVNARTYVECNCDFVMGTTGADASKLMDIVQGSEVTAVIAPNMGKQIVAMQAILQQMSVRFPNSFEGYTLSVSVLISTCMCE